MKKYAVIVAGGSGVRMGSMIPKQFLLIQQKPIIYYSIKAFLDAFKDIEIIVVLPKEHFNYTHTIQSFFSATINFTEGGSTRYNSVKNGLETIKEEGVVFIHDAVRCLVTPNLIQTCYSICLEKGNAVPAINCVDSMRQVLQNKNSIIDRSTLKVIQTPQTFFVQKIKEAFSLSFEPYFTDEASVAEAALQEIILCQGEPYNLKITTPVDLIIAEKIIEERQNA